MTKIDDDDKEKDQQKWRDIIGLTGRAAGTFAPASIAIIGGTITGNPLAIAVGAAQAAGYLLKEAADAVLHDRKSELTDRVGPETIATIASKAAANGGEMRALWQRLLTNCVDVNFKGQIRPAQIELLNTLIAPDAALMFTLGKFQAEMAQEQEVTDIHKQITFETSRNSEHPMRHFVGAIQQAGTTYRLIRRYWNAGFGTELQIDDEDLAYSLMDQNGKLFSTTTFALPPSNSMMKQEHSGSFSTACQGPYGGLVVARLTEQAARLVRLLDVPSPARRE